MGPSASPYFFVDRTMPVLPATGSIAKRPFDVMCRRPQDAGLAARVDFRAGSVCRAASLAGADRPRDALIRRERDDRCRPACPRAPMPFGSGPAVSYTLSSAMRKRSFDQIEVGETHETPGVTVTDWHVMNFAAVSMDFFELHTNEEYARQTQFGRRVAHGLMGLAIADGLKHRSTFQVEAIASLHWSWDFVGPVHVGDTIRARLRVAEKRPSRSKPDRGIVFVEYEVVNQLDEVVQKGTNRMMVKRC